MGTTDRTAAERMKRMDARRRAQGLVKVTVWAYPEHRELLRYMAKEFREKRESDPYSTKS